MAHAGYDWRTFTKVANTTPSVTDQPAYGLFNAGLPSSHAQQCWRFALDGKNLTNKYYRVAGYDFGDPPMAPPNPSSAASARSASTARRAPGR